jgi:hypothetical protein
VVNVTFISDGAASQFKHFLFANLTFSRNVMKQQFYGTSLPLHMVEVLLMELVDVIL